MRGLPTSREVNLHPDIMIVFKTLLLHTIIEVEPGHECAGLKMCHLRGWVTSSINPMSIPQVIRYEFPSPLHLSWVSWMMTRTHQPVPFANVFDLIVAALAHFRPSHLHVSAGSSLNDPRPETSYQQELYRGFHIVADGTVVMSPEFASSEGAAVADQTDFYVPQTKWGIKLTWDSSPCFASMEVYRSWLTSQHMEDYILLNCCKTKPHYCCQGENHVYLDETC